MPVLGNKIIQRKNRNQINITNATAIYSLRKLRQAYNGAAIRVRRSSDNSELDIGFNSNGDLDITTLLNFVGSGDGFVSWYDQSGNNYTISNLIQSQQPLIVSNGTLTQPTFDGLDDFLSLPPLTFGGAFSFSCWVYIYNVYRRWQRIFDFNNGQSAQNLLFGSNGESGRMRFQSYRSTGGSIESNDIPPQNTWIHFTVLTDNLNNGKMYLNGNLIASGNIDIGQPIQINNMFIGKSAWSSDSLFAGMFAEIIMFNKALTQQEVINLFNNKPSFIE